MPGVQCLRYDATSLQKVRKSAMGSDPKSLHCRALGAGQDLKEFDCDHKLGLTALKRLFTDVMGNSSAMPDVKVQKLLL